MAALGGSGTTGWDWVINAFTMAGAAFPNSMLLINEFGTEQEPTTRATYLQIIALLKARGLIV
jgi:endo-1,4-beta-xylanase